MTYEKWMEEMVREMAKEILIPSNKENLNGIDKRYDFIGEDEENEERLEE
jgi:hypothetical protein